MVDIIQVVLVLDPIWDMKQHGKEIDADVQILANVVYWEFVCQELKTLSPTLSTENHSGGGVISLWKLVGHVLGRIQLEFQPGKRFQEKHEIC